MAITFNIPAQTQSDEFKLLVNKAVEDLHSGAIVVMPSDTLYGIFTPFREDLVKKLHLVKKRPMSKPFLLVLPESYPLEEFINLDLLTKEMKLHIQKFWPGRNTLLLPKKSELFYPLGDSIALRKPSKQDNAFFYTVLNTYGKPLLAPSLNVHRDAPLSRLDDMIRIFGNDVHTIFFDDFFMPGMASQIWDLTGKSISRLR